MPELAYLRYLKELSCCVVNPNNYQLTSSVLGNRSCINIPQAVHCVPGGVWRRHSVHRHKRRLYSDF